ncbi:hypothetical protein BG011_010248 [Mortierella polycephala]|uniref:Uncharacterized protein n=1 Tax=Mortierella polycephala TaxID=41804 RepID=A0A9P6Q9P6_9FUNG|nr:hypothetical protein BG011_010248 [Mortierella polycephala]
MPFQWTVPSVGDAIIGGGTEGVCPQNTFHFQFTGRVVGIAAPSTSSCGKIIIQPEPNNRITTTPPALSPTPTRTPTQTQAPEQPSDDEGGLSMMETLIIAGSIFTDAEQVHAAENPIPEGPKDLHTRKPNQHRHEVQEVGEVMDQDQDR